MNQRDSPQAINDQAAEWVARIDSAPLDAAVQAELDEWLARSDRHRGALFRATIAWRMLDRASALGHGEIMTKSAHEVDRPVDARQDETDPEGAIDPRFPRRRFLWSGGAIAASLAAAGVGWRFWSHGPERIETALGEIRHMSFQDGSLASINTASKMEVNFRPNARNVRLEAGEAWFQVAKDSTRPFVVSVEDVRVRAVGTAFSVHRLDQGVDVQVTEGAVEVWSGDQERNKEIVPAGLKTFVSYSQGPQAPVEDAVGIDRKLSWRDGALKFEGDTLGEAAAEFNRYNAVKLEIDPALANEKIVGRFRTNEPDTFAKSTSVMLGTRVTIGEGRILVAKN